jgi:hypothetical protein
MRCFRLFVGSGVLAVVYLVSPAQAAITYVDAELNSAAAGYNTTEVGGGAHAFSASASGSDNLWRFRNTTGGNNSSMWESNGDGTVPPNNTENAPRLVTTISGLAPGTYEIYAYFVGNHEFMRMGASLTNPGALTQLPIYTVGTSNPPGDAIGDLVTDADLANFTNTVTNDTGFDNGTFPDTLFQASLGRATTLSGQIQVFIDDDTSAAVLAARIANPSANGNLWRTVYEGVGYELVPEPGSLLLLVLGCWTAAAARRR